MYIPKRGFEAESESLIEYFPMRAMSDRDQTFIDIVVTIDGDRSLDPDLGYFVSFNRYGGPGPNSVYGINYPVSV